MLKNLYKSLLASALLAGSFTACSNDKNVAGGTEAESTVVALQIQVSGNAAYSFRTISWQKRRPKRNGSKPMKMAS